MALIQALDHNDQEEILRLLENNPEEFQSRDEEERTALHYAAEACDLETFQKIFDIDKVLIDSVDKNGHTPLMNALMVGKPEIATFLQKNGANVNHLDNEGHNIVHWTTVCGQLESLNWAIEQKVDINSKDYAQLGTAVHYATVSDDIAPEVAQAVLITLLKNGGQANARDKDERTPLLWCASNGNIEAMILLINSGGDLTAKDRDNLGALHCAASHGYHEVIDVAMSRVPRSLVDEQDRAGHTPLFYAVTFGHYESALKLLQYGADPNHQDHRLRTAGHCAAAKGQMRMLKLLKQYNASFDIQNYRGDTPFHEAVQSGSKDVVEWLLAMDTTVLDAQNHHGRTGLHLAAASGNLEMVILLCTKKCFVDPLMSIKEDVFTPLDIAKEQNHEVVVEYLTKLCGAKSKNDLSPEYIDSWKTSFEEMVTKAKLERDKRLSTQKLNRDKKQHNPVRRPSTTSGVIASEKQIVDVGVNTSTRTTRSAHTNREKPSISKATSVTNLEDDSIEKKKQNDRITEEAVKINHEKEAEYDERVDYLDVDEEFENLPPLSEEESETSLDTNDTFGDSDAENEPENGKEGNEKSAEKIIIENQKIEKNGKKKTKAVRIAEANANDLKEKSRTKTGSSSSGKVVMRVRREPEIGSDGGDVDIYEDNDEGKQSRDGSRSPVLSNRRYIHERAIFQELTHLKRMQIQYGKVQERVLVRSLISNFCKMHGLDMNNFKFQTFYAWEKFLYDSRIRRSVPFNEKIREMQRIYTNSTMSSTRRNKVSTKITGAKRCDCLEKHILL